MMTLGIPGDAATAIIMGALMVHGLNPGPKLFSDQGDIVYAIILGLIITNVLMLFQGKILVPFFQRFSKIKYSYLAPIITVFCFAGAFSINNTIFDNYIVVIVALLSVVMFFLDIPRAPMLLGLILGNIIESNLLRALVISEGSLSIFVTRPISLFFLVLAVSSFALPLIKTIHKAKRNKNL
jgi:putative tricarboxylic transport membrane protein